MTNRQRLQAILDRRMPDRIPWIPRLEVWYEARRRANDLPESCRNRSLREIERDLGMGTPARDGRVFKTRYLGVEVRARKTEEWTTVTEYETPLGTLTAATRGSRLLRSQGIRDMDAQHLVKGPADYPAAEYLIEHTEYAPCYDEFLAYDAQVGDDGLPMVIAGDCPFHYWLADLVGYNHAYYHLQDFPDKVERLLDRVTCHDREALWPVLAHSPARLILHGMHFSSSMTPPPLYERYILPYYRELSDYLHRHGKSLCMHADADSRLILRHIRDSGYDMAETFTTWPMVKCTLAEARAAFGAEVIIWGAVPSVLLEPTYSDDFLESYMKDLFRTIAPGNAFILGVADNVMPGAMIERIRRISDMVEAWGDCPIDPGRIPAG